MVRLPKQIAAALPSNWQNEVKRLYCRLQIRRGAFTPSEPEYDLLATLIDSGDWVIDVGANVGHYTKRFSELVGGRGRVIAFEPVPDTFALLASNLQTLSAANVTLINAAVSDRTSIAAMSIPAFDTGLLNFYEARISDSTGSKLQVLTLPLDALNFANRIALVKIDAEGHDYTVLQGMQQILLRDRPIVIVESNSPEIQRNLRANGYTAQKLPKSPNTIYRPTVAGGKA